jgi:hypothetical protein
MLDKLSAEAKIISSYTEVCHKFGFLTRRRDATDDHNTFEETEVENLLKTYHHDTRSSVKDEWLHFTELIESKASATLRHPLSVKVLEENFLADVFPNVFILYRLYQPLL